MLLYTMCVSFLNKRVSVSFSFLLWVSVSLFFCLSLPASLTNRPHDYLLAFFPLPASLPHSLSRVVPGDRNRTTAIPVCRACLSHNTNVCGQPVSHLPLLRLVCVLAKIKV